MQIVPPSGWRARSSGYADVDSLVRSSGKQMSEGDDGAYCLTVEECGGVYMSDFKKLAQSVSGSAV